MPAGRRPLDSATIESPEIICPLYPIALASDNPSRHRQTELAPVTLPAQNLLADEASPYLQQHSGNPVHWRAWSPAALAEAKALQRPILLSVGYAACHWCHVMAHESFENDAVAAVMNRLFVNIKVDREERPDIDQIYMAALSSMGEQGGWPLTMFLTPDGKPFWGGTYFPREARYGRPGFIQVMEAVDKAWREKRESLDQSADGLTNHVEARLAGVHAKAVLDNETLSDLAGRIDGMIDRDLGGLRGAPKFPNAPFMHTLWLSWLRDGVASHRDAVLVSLEKMLAGGIYDHVGGGLEPLFDRRRVAGAAFRKDALRQCPADPPVQLGLCRDRQ